MIQSSGHHLLRCSNCHCCAVPITTGKKRYSCLSIVTLFQIRLKKNKNLAGARSLLRPKKKRSSRLSGGCMIVITTGKKISCRLLGPAHSNYDQKKRYSCLSVVTPFQIRPEKKPKIWQVRERYYDQKKKFQSSVWQVHDRYYNRKKSSSRLLGPDRSNYDRKKKDTVVCPLLRRSKYDRKKNQKSGGCAIVITTGKKSSSHLSGGCMIIITTGKKSSSHLLGPAYSKYD